MFYISIPKGVFNKVMDIAKSTDDEVIGILVGNVENHTIVIEDAVSGEQESNDTRATLAPKTIAEVTDKILKGDIEGRIIGWYHSHPGFGIFMSSTDVNTQRNLQQFSSKVTALIVDPENEDFGFFTLHGSEGAIRLEEDQVNVYEEGEKKIPERFSSPPKIPKKTVKRGRKIAGVMPPPPEPTRMNTKLIVFGVSAAVIFVAITGMIFFRNIIENPEYSSVDSISLFGEREKNQQNIWIYHGVMEVRANVTVKEGKITQEGLRFYLSLKGGGWQFLGNNSTPFNDTYVLFFNTRGHEEGIHYINVNFTDTLNNTWERASEPFIIDNIPDIPDVSFMNLRRGDTLNGNKTVYVEVKDEENNIYSVKFFYLNSTRNWSEIGKSRYVEYHLYATDWDTNQFRNGTYTIKVVAEDRNLYMDEEMITVNIQHGR
ncbi:MAG: Mov34/MPN/PAD-1 family protein [Thermoplasmata archaeon]